MAGMGRDIVGRLVGWQQGGSIITASYATGDADGGDGDDRVGGLVGWQGVNGKEFNHGELWLWRNDWGGIRRVVGWLDKTSRSQHSGSADRSQYRVGLEQCRWQHLGCLEFRH